MQQNISFCNNGKWIQTQCNEHRHHTFANLNNYNKNGAVDVKNFLHQFGSQLCFTLTFSFKFCSINEFSKSDF